MPESIRYFFDEDVSRHVAVGLRRRGVDLITVQELGQQGMADSEHFQWAQTQERVIVSQDTDFLQLARIHPDHAGIVFAPYGCSIGRMVTGLFFIWEALEPADMRGRVEYL